MRQNTTTIVATRKGFVLHSDGALWTTGPHAFLCGYVSDPGNIDIAIDEHEEVLRIERHRARIAGRWVRAGA
jgi:hypothetical protein